MKSRGKNRFKGVGLLLLIILAAVIPICGLGVFFLKLANDLVLAERTRVEQRELELMSIVVADVETLVREENEAFEFSNQEQVEEWIISLRTHDLLAGVRIDPELNESFIEKKRSLKVSQWLLSPKDHEAELKDWLQLGSALYSRAYVLFVLRESGLANDDDLAGMGEGLLWELDESDKRGVNLKGGGRVLWNIESPKWSEVGGIVGTRGFSLSKENYERAIEGMGMELGLVRNGSRSSDIEKWIEKGSERKRYLIGGCLLWLFVLVLGLLVFAHRRNLAARESVDVVSTVAHEFRTPLTGMGLLLERLRNEQAENGEIEDYLELIEGERYRLERVVEQFLVQGKLKRGSLELERVEWNHWLSAEVERFVVLSNDRSKFCLVEEGKHFESSEVYFDRGLLGLALRNLLRNAESYGGTGVVKVLLLEDDVSVGCEVQDRGPGMSADLVKRAFGKYERGEEGLARMTDGLGLGLSLVKEIVELHGGTVELNSEIGGGTKVRFLLLKERRKGDV